MATTAAAIVFASLLAGQCARTRAAAAAPWWLAALDGPQEEAVAVAASSAAPIDVTRVMLPQLRGMDWTRAGYREGAVRIPDPPITYNVRFKQFGAKGDGVADDTRALQAAVAAANANPNGGVIFLPRGTYLLRTPLTITRSRVVLRGEGEGKTIIFIPRSLSHVFQGTWAVYANGSYQSAWNSGGGFITVQGSKQRSRNDDSRLSYIRGPGVVLRGSRVIPVRSSAKFRAGQRIRIFLNDNSTASKRRLQAAPSTAGAAASAASSMRLVHRVAPPAVRNSPVYRAAMEGAAALGELGEGLTGSQALAADRDFASQNGEVGISAAPGTVVAWLYGGNLVDSGPETEVIDKDEIQCLAVVAAVGNRSITLDRPLCFSVAPQWEASIHLDQPTVQDVGVEKLTIRFKHSINQQHHADRGFNALQFSHVANCWVRNVSCWLPQLSLATAAPASCNAAAAVAAGREEAMPRRGSSRRATPPWHGRQ